MPIIHIEMLEGRDNKVKEELIKQVKKQVSDILMIDEERVHLIINELKIDNIG